MKEAVCWRSSSGEFISAPFLPWHFVSSLPKSVGYHENCLSFAGDHSFYGHGHVIMNPFPTRCMASSRFSWSMDYRAKVQLVSVCAFKANTVSWYILLARASACLASRQAGQVTVSNACPVEYCN